MVKIPQKLSKIMTLTEEEKIEDAPANNIMLAGIIFTNIKENGLLHSS